MGLQVKYTSTNKLFIKSVAIPIKNIQELDKNQIQRYLKKCMKTSTQLCKYIKTKEMACRKTTEKSKVYQLQMLVKE